MSVARLRVYCVLTLPNGSPPAPKARKPAANVQSCTSGAHPAHLLYGTRPAASVEPLLPPLPPGGSALQLLWRVSAQPRTTRTDTATAPAVSAVVPSHFTGNAFCSFCSTEMDGCQPGSLPSSRPRLGTATLAQLTRCGVRLAPCRTTEFQKLPKHVAVIVDCKCVLYCWLRCTARPAFRSLASGTPRSKCLLALSMRCIVRWSTATRLTIAREP